MSLVEWSSPFMTTVMSYDDIVPNTYECTLGISPTTNNTEYQNIGFERIKFFLRNICQNSVLISIHNKKFNALKKLTCSNIITLPDEPYDQLLIVLLFHKIDAILEEHFYCDYIVLESFQGENVKYQFNAEYDSTFVDDTNYFSDKLKEKKLPWWYRGDTSTSDTFKDMTIDVPFTWDDVGLSYKNNKKKESKGEIVNLKQFVPKVIDGKK